MKTLSTRTLSLTALAMLAFAANSVLNRLALASELIDAAGFTSIRLLSGALALFLIVFFSKRQLALHNADWRSALMLFVYAVCFSFAYLALATGTGALILFACVQLTMILAGLVQGERPSLLAWIGIMVAFAGLVYLLLPGVSAPPLSGALLMALAGIAWGIYSLRGRSVGDPVAATARNFILTIPLALLLSFTFLPSITLSWAGVMLAIASGALASGIGYVIWYAALPALRPASAATVQLSVPIIAACAGILLLGEPLTLRLLIAGILTLGGITLVIRY